ncbi:hypothetical protein SB847_21160, partial [Bacillus sp. SIMBA_026]
MLLQRCQTFHRLLTVEPDNRQHQFGFAGEVMMDAGFAYANPLRQVRIAEAVVAARSEQLPGVLGDFVGSGGE